MPQLLGWLDRTDNDVVCFQETKTIDEKFPIDDLQNAGYEAAFMGQKSYNGVAIISKTPPDDVVKGFPDDDGESPKRMIAATVGGVRIVNTYVPNGSELWSEKFTFKLDWLQRLRKFFDETCDKRGDVLLCGDFNVAPDERDVWNVAAAMMRIDALTKNARLRAIVESTNANFTASRLPSAVSWYRRVCTIDECR